MIFLPIVGRELRVTARRRGTYWTRLGAALAALVIVGWVMLFPELRSPQRIGMALFVPLSILAFGYSLLTGVRTTSDCLSEEKREGTLGLLFLTDLKGYDIVFGKLAATSVSAFYGLLAIFPVLAIPLLAGGVAGSELWRVTLACLNNAFFSLAVGMFCSAVSTDERKAMVASFLILLVLTGGLPLAVALLANWLGEWPPAPLSLFPSPGFYSFLAFDATIKSVKFPHAFYYSLAFVHALGWALLALACYIVPRSWHDVAETPAAARRRARKQAWTFGSPATRLALRRRLLAINPYYWLASRDRLKRAVVWTFIAIGIVIWAWGLAANPRDWKEEGAYFLTGFIAQAVLKCWVAMEACQRFCMDRRSGALELLLSTPISVREVLRGQLAALFKQFSGPVAVVLLADAVFLMAGRGTGSEWVLMCLAGMAVFVADLVTLSVLGMWLGLRSRATSRAAAAAIARILVLPWGLFALFMTVLVVSNLGRQLFPSSLTGELVIAGWMAIALAVDVAFGVPAWRRLRDEFRAVATQRVETRAPRGVTQRAQRTPQREEAVVGA